MKTTRVQALIALVLACGLILISTSLFAQNAREPLGHPVSKNSHSPSVPLGPLPQPRLQLPRLGGTTIGQSFNGIDFLGSNCGCLPPDNGTGVSPLYVVEVVNVQIRVWLKSSLPGPPILDEALSNIFGAPTGGDPYALYDKLADRWYLTGFDSSDSGEFLAVSVTNDPTGAYYVYDLTDIGGFPDFLKTGYNKDAIFLSYNDFGSNGGYAGVAVVNKATALSGNGGNNLVHNTDYFTSYPPPQFRAIPPARMGDDLMGGTEWFMSIWDFGGNTVRVTKMTNYLTPTPHYTTWELPVQPFGDFVNADQPGGAGSVVDNDPTATVVHIHNHQLVTATWASTATDGFLYPKGHYYQVDVHTGIPKLMTEGLIDPGPGVAVYMVAADQDKGNGFGLTWMESSLNEYVSMWVGTRPPIYPFGWINASDVAPGGGFMPYSFRTGDYGSTEIDPGDPTGMTYWSSNEYIGNDGYNDIWNTWVASYQRP
jgi:hypothetical protein